VPCGLKRKQQMMLNPPDSEVVCEGDEILVLAEDDDTYAPHRGLHPKQEGAFNDTVPSFEAEAPKPMSFLFLGWRRDIGDMILQLGELVEGGSALVLMNQVPVEERIECFKWQDRDLSVLPDSKLHVVHERGDIRNRGHLTKLPMSSFHSILVLSEANSEVGESRGWDDSDANTLATMLLVRNIQASSALRAISPNSTPLRDQAEWVRQCRMMEGKQRGTLARRRSFDATGSTEGPSPSAGMQANIICEILDSRTKSLQAVPQSCDMIMSHELVSKYLAMVSERAEVNAVLAELFKAEGNEVHIRPVPKYVAPDEMVTFWDVMRRGRTCNEIVIGYYQHHQLDDKNKKSGPSQALIAQDIILNPKEKWKKMPWSRCADCFIVIAEE